MILKEWQTGEFSHADGSSEVAECKQAHAVEEEWKPEVEEEEEEGECNFLGAFAWLRKTIIIFVMSIYIELVCH
jgi:hypothetical protein